VGSLARVYPSKQQACQELNRFQDFNFSAVVAPLVVRTKKIKRKLWNNACCVFWKLRPRSWRDQYIVGPPNLKVWGPVSPGPYGCCAYVCIRRQSGGLVLDLENFAALATPRATVSAADKRRAAVSSRNEKETREPWTSLVGVVTSSPSTASWPDSGWSVTTSLSSSLTIRQCWSCTPGPCNTMSCLTLDRPPPTLVSPAHAH